jgi:hypothetical protein
MISKCIIFFITAQLTCLRADSFAQRYAIDSAVFRIDGLTVCSELGSPCTYYHFPTYHQDYFHFIVGTTANFSDTAVIFIGKGNFISRDTQMRTGILQLIFYRSGVLKSFYYGESDTMGGSTSFTINITNVVLRPKKEVYVLTGSDTAQGDLQVRFNEYCDPISNWDDVCIGKVLSNDSLNNITLFGFTEGVKESAVESNFIMYPNPSTSTVTMKGISSPSIEILDLLGRVMLTQRIQQGSGEVEVDISNLREGCYWVRSGASVQKLLISR